MKSTWEEKQVNKVEQIFQDENHTCEFNNGEKLIDEVHVWTIQDWNQQYGKFPARKLKI